VIAWARGGDETEHLDEALAGIGLALTVKTTPAHASAGFGASREGRGLIVERLPPEGAAALAGLRIGDRVLGIDGPTLPTNWPYVLATHTPGTLVTLQVLRGYERLLLHVTLQARSEVTATVAPLRSGATPAAARLRDAFLDP
jgi:predicted metalloprotease with PDZ domain